MAVDPADSPVLGALYGTDAVCAVMGEHAFLQRMLDAEAALARAQAPRLGIVLTAAAEAVTAAASADWLDLKAAAAATRNTGGQIVAEAATMGLAPKLGRG